MDASSSVFIKSWSLLILMKELLYCIFKLFQVSMGAHYWAQQRQVKAKQQRIFHTNSVRYVMFTTVQETSMLKH
jgi:hypothetical protein